MSNKVIKRIAMLIALLLALIMAASLIIPYIGL